MKITFTSNLGRLADDAAAIPPRAKTDMVRCVRGHARAGKDLAKGYAKVSAGSHGKRYPNSFSITPLGPMSYEYGPVSSAPQGNMSFEGGSRNQPPHRDLARSLEREGPKFRRDVAALPDKWFWGAG